MEHQRVIVLGLVMESRRSRTEATRPEGGCLYMLTKGADEQTKEAVYKFAGILAV